MKILFYFINVLMDISRNDDYGNKKVKLVHLFLIILEKLTKKLFWLNIKKGIINKNIFLKKLLLIIDKLYF